MQAQQSLTLTYSRRSQARRKRNGGDGRAIRCCCCYPGGRSHGVKRLRWREKICGILRNVRDRTNPTSLQAELQTILEHDHGSTASSIASRLIASAADQEDSCLNVLRLMDDRHKLVSYYVTHFCRLSTSLLFIVLFCLARRDLKHTTLKISPTQIRWKRLSKKP